MKSAFVFVLGFLILVFSVMFIKALKNIIYFFFKKEVVESTEQVKEVDSGSGFVKIPSFAILIPCFILTLIGLLSIPMERATVVNEVKTTGLICLPHVVPKFDRYTWIMDTDCDVKLRNKVNFCKDKGFVPPFMEGQSMHWMRYRKWDDCIELIAASPVLDEATGLVKTEPE